MSDDIVLDDPNDKVATDTVKTKSVTPAWMVILVVLSGLFLVGALALQFMEYSYLRGGA